MAISFHGPDSNQVYVAPEMNSVGHYATQSPFGSIDQSLTEYQIMAKEMQH